MLLGKYYTSQTPYITSGKVYQGPAGGEARSMSRDWENRKRKRWTTTAGVPESNDVTSKRTEGLQVQKG